MKKHPRILLALSGALVALAAASCSVNAATYEKGNPVKVGLICLHDTSSTYDKNFIDGMNQAAENLKVGNRIAGDPIIKTGVAEDNDCYTAAKDLVKQGCNVIFADSFGHEEFMLKAAKEWPTVTFCHATGTKAKVAGVANYHNAFASIYEGRFLAGAAAGLKLQHMIDEGKIEDKNMRDGNIILGYVGAFPYAEVVSGYTSWFLGVKSQVENVCMDVTFTESWYSVDKEQAAATMLINRGAAIISEHADSMGAPGECAKNHVPNVTYNIPTPEYEETYVSFSRIDWAPYYETVVNSMFMGTGIVGEVNNNWTGTLATGSVEYGVADSTPIGDQAILMGLEAELASGVRKVFDCADFTVNGEHITSYKADVDDMGDYAPETEVIKKVGDTYFFDESSFRSAPYFDIAIDGITKLN